MQRDDRNQAGGNIGEKPRKTYVHKHRVRPLACRQRAREEPVEALIPDRSGREQARRRAAVTSRRQNMGDPFGPDPGGHDKQRDARQ